VQPVGALGGAQYVETYTLFEIFVFFPAEQSGGALSGAQDVGLANIHIYF
jgi:hypothetical protein